MNDLNLVGKKQFRRISRAAKLFFVVIFIFCGLTVFAQKSDPDVKNLMMINLESVVSILHNVLYDQEYDQIKKSVERIIEHGERLKTHEFANDLAANSMFQKQGHQLEVFAKNLGMYVNLIIDMKAKGDDISSHRIIVAANYGQVITACVTCHSNFRKR